MKIWIDISAPPHVNFFRPLIERFEDDVIVTARDFSTIKESLNRLGIKHKLTGSHGRTKKQRLMKSSERTIELAKLIEKEKPDISLSKHSVECPRVCFGLGIPSISVLDHETATIQNRLIIPLSDVMVTPSFIPKNLLKEYGARRIVQFYGVCEYNDNNFKPSKEVLDKLNVSKNHPLILSRAEPFLSSHVFHKSSLFQVLEDISDQSDSQIIFFPRNESDKREFSKLDVTIANEVDTLSLYKFANLMVGAGCTMNREACLFGCPTVSTYPDELPAVNNFLIKNGLMKHTIDKEEAVEWCLEFIENGKIEKKKLESIIKNFENPYDVIIREINRLIQ